MILECHLQILIQCYSLFSGKDTEFWAAYNYIMDTDLIDSCREFNGETCNTDDLCQPNDNVQNINNKANSEPSGSQRSSNEDPRRLRRWLTEMEKRFTKSPTFTEAMKLNSVELQKTLSEFEVSVVIYLLIIYLFFSFRYLLWLNSLIYHKKHEHMYILLMLS